MEENKMTKYDEIFNKLVMEQRLDIPANKRLQLRDIKRIARRVGGSIYDQNKCALWNGYITNVNNAIKGTYVNFYFRKKKVALHRLLFINFIDDLHDDEYLKFNCENKGKCCNIYHMNKFKYNMNVNEKNDENDNEPNENSKSSEKYKSKKSQKPLDDSSLSSSELILTFD